MAKYAVTAEVTIETTIEPQGYIAEPYIDGVEDFDADSFSSYGNDIEDTTEVRFSYESDSDESEVQDEIEALLNSHLSYEGDDVSWEVTGVSITSCEKEEMSLEDAKDVLRTFLDTLGNLQDHPGLKEAVEVILAAI